MVEQFNTWKNANVALEMAFPRAEYQSRIAKVRKAMAEQGIDVLLVQHTPNFCYLAGYQSPLAYWFGCLVLPQEGEPIAIVPLQEIANLMVHGWDNENIYLFDWQDNRKAPTELIRALKERGFADKRLGIEIQLPGWGGYTALQVGELLPDARIIDASDVVMHFRVAKSPSEMAHVREAARLTDIGMQAALEAVAPGKKDTDVAAASYAAMVGAGSEYLSIQPLVYAGYAGGMLHVAPKRRVMNVGDTVPIEVSGVYHRYSAPLVRTAVIGQPSDLVKSLAEFSIAQLELLEKHLRPGRSASEVARAVTADLKTLEPKISELQRRYGFTVRSQRRYGYSVGVGFPPDWVEHSIYIDEGYDRVLEEGMLFHTPIGVRTLGKFGVSFSAFWAITATGCEMLTRLPRELTVVPA